MICILNAVFLDLKRQRDTLLLRLDKVFQKIAGLDDYPVHSTISRFLKRFTVRTGKWIAHVNRKILREARGNFEGWGKITLDLDSHERISYGHQQRALVGYNPKKPGRPSFHPISAVYTTGVLYNPPPDFPQPLNNESDVTSMDVEKIEERKVSHCRRT